jgi:hypothetical protein
MPPPSDGEGNIHLPDVGSGTETLPLTPGHAGPFTILTTDELTSLWDQGASVNDIIRSIVPPEIATLSNTNHA